MEDGGSKKMLPMRDPRSSIFDPRASAFTLIEILVVVTILLVLTALVVTVFNINAGADKLRSSARTAQSAILGARDRALHAGERRGMRLIRDPQDPTLVVGFAYLQPLPIQSFGQPGTASVAVARTDLDNNHFGNDASADDPHILLISGSEGQFLSDLDVQGLLPATGTRFRIPAGSAGQWYTPLSISAGPPYFVTMQAGNAVVQLTSNVIKVDRAMPSTQSIDASTGSAELDLGNELLPNHTPISLPSGVVIDLDYSSPNIVANWPSAPQRTNIDLMFSPRGMLIGPLAALGPIHFLLNDIQDATQNLNPIDPANKGEKLILTIFPQTGNIATFPIDPTDAVNNTTGAAGADGLADDLFRYAKRGSTAGQ